MCFFFFMTSISNSFGNFSLFLALNFLTGWGHNCWTFVHKKKLNHVVCLLVSANSLPVSLTHFLNCLLPCDKDDTQLPNKKKASYHANINKSLISLILFFCLSTSAPQSILLLGAIALLCLGLDLLFLLFYSFWLCCRRRKSDDSLHSHTHSQQPSADCCCTAWCVIIATLVCRWEVIPRMSNSLLQTG